MNGIRLARVPTMGGFGFDGPFGGGMGQVPAEVQQQPPTAPPPAAQPAPAVPAAPAEPAAVVVRPAPTSTLVVLGLIVVGLGVITVASSK